MGGKTQGVDSYLALGEGCGGETTVAGTLQPPLQCTSRDAVPDPSRDVLPRTALVLFDDTESFLLPDRLDCARLRTIQARGLVGGARNRGRAACLVAVRHAVELVASVNELRPEGGRDELRRGPSLLGRLRWCSRLRLRGRLEVR